MEPTATRTPAPHGDATTLPVVTEYIGIRPGYCGGEPHILGHRIKVRHIAVWHDQMGMAPTEIAATYPTITLAQVHAALAYYYDHRDEIRAAIEDEHRFVEELKGSHRSRSCNSSFRQGSPMPRTIRYDLDEHCDPAIATGLRLHGVEVTTTPEAGLLHARDEEHIAFGIATRRVIFTQDQDFLRLHAAGMEHRGIAFCD